LTTPKVNTINRGGSRFYVNPDSGRKNPGVTSVLNMLPKPFLTFWSSKVVAEYAVENIGEVVGIAMKDPKAAIDLLKGAPRRFTANSADVGSEAHDAFEHIAKGEEVRITPNLKPFIEHFREFLEVAKPEFVFLEETVWSDEHGFAGSFDALARLTGDGVGDLKGKLLFMDWKTTRSGVHEEVALQLCAYSRATHIIRPDGSRVPLPKADGGAVLWVRPEGWKLVPVETGEVTLSEPVVHEPTGDVVVPGQTVDIFDYFLALREVLDWDSEVKKRVIGKPVAAGGEFKSGEQSGPINKPAARTRAKAAAK
jgi:hypothetical protein